jgi:hypothetical protein
MLSARTIFFTQSALKFECHAHSVWEGFGPGVTGPSWSARLGEVTHKTWLDLVEEYTRRDITRPSDRLPAMAATMRRIAKVRGWSPLWGMWANAPVDSLAWETERWNGPGSKHLCRVRPGFYAPTWSWASLEGPVSYGQVSLTDHYDPVVDDLEVKKWDAAKGVITVSGRVAAKELRCEISKSPWDEGEENRLEYKYEFPGLSLREGGAMGMSADAALQPWAGDIGGERVSTIIRVPHGALWPDKSWAGEVMCLVVQKQTLRCLVLVLGRSRRVPGAWERIGIVSGPDPSLFGGAERIALDIV